LQLNLDRDAAHKARCAVRDGVGGAISPLLLEDVLLVVTELVTNSVRHTGFTNGTVQLSITSNRRELVIEVQDPGSGFDVPTSRSPNAGYGLRIVDLLSKRWGVDPDKSRVWCVLGNGKAPSAFTARRGRRRPQTKLLRL
jgi:anti-sigma regulatory factor (Ser/Thr protein kinase)